jgi:hypothetical protein
MLTVKHQGDRSTVHNRVRIGCYRFNNRGGQCASSGCADEDTIKKYIENQKWDEEDQGFKITAPSEP